MVKLNYTAETPAAPAVQTEAAEGPPEKALVADSGLLAQIRASIADRKYRRYWVEVSGDTAMELEGLGLIVRHLDKAGKPTPFPITREPEGDLPRALALAAGRLRRGSSSPHCAGAPPLEFLGDDVVGDVRGPHLSICADDLVSRIIPRVIDALRMSDPAVPVDIELNDASDTPAVDRENDLAVDKQTSVDNSQQGVHHRVFTEKGSVPVNSQPGQNTSPSVGAPNGALRDNSNPTEGDLNPGGAE